MATLSTHTLNGTDGSHAGGVAVTLVRIQGDGSRETLFAAETDAGGRLLQDIDPGLVDPGAIYELVFATGRYWSAQAAGSERTRIVDEIVVRLAMPDADARYHVPIIISPHAYSIWSSMPERGAE